MAAVNEVRVRFAPSPTGYLHIGSARTALFNYLYARRHKGKFILRIEDTDQNRSTVESLRNIIDSLLWLNIKWDEGPVYELPSEGEEIDSMGPYGPYFQHKRDERYREYGRKLLDAGLAYLCNCPPTEVVGGSTCHCRSRQDEINPQDANSIKFAIPKGVTEVHDLIRGQVVFDNSTIDDFLMIRPNGIATYNFAVVCDDIDMRVTHVIRGEDHLSNTPKQIMIYHALGYEPPALGHIPLIHGDDGVRLSKRHGVVSVDWYREQGFLPEAFVNYLARLGWSDGTDQEFFTLDELERKFDISGVAKSPAKFDYDKLIWFNGKYIRQLNDEKLYRVCEPRLVKAGLIVPDEMTPGKKEWVKAILSLYRERIRYLGEVPELIEYFFNDPQEYLLKDLQKAKVDSKAMALLEGLLWLFEGMNVFHAKALEEMIKNFIGEKEVDLGRVIHPLRLAVTGRRATPGMFETLQLLGQKRVLRRLGKFVRRVKPVES
jgi:glutamyl-tRNA synthetase